MKPLSERLLERAEAYPEDVFGPITNDERKFYASIIQRAAAQMGRHMAPMLREAAALAKSVESAPVVTVDPLTHGGFGVIVTARDMIGQRVALVPLPQQSET